MRDGPLEQDFRAMQQKGPGLKDAPIRETTATRHGLQEVVGKRITRLWNPRPADVDFAISTQRIVRYSGNGNVSIREEKEMDALDES